jgi:hypothetical protein
MKKLGEIAKSHGFDSISDFYEAINNKIDIIKHNSFNVGDVVRLKHDYNPTHFNNEKMLPKNTPFIICEKSSFTLDKYQIKFEGYDDWFNASIFELNI